MWIICMSILSCISLPLVLLEYYFTKERVTAESNGQEEKKIPFTLQLKAIFTDKYMLLLLGYFLLYTEFLQRAVEENTGADAELMLADIIEARDGSEAAQVYITRQLQRHPTMRVFHKLMDYHLNEAEEGRAKESLMVLRDMVGEKVRSKPRYRCQKCGFTAYTLYWHCPSCRAWSTIKPIRGLDGL